MTKIAQRRALTAALVVVCVLAAVRLIVEATSASGGSGNSTAAPAAVRTEAARDSSPARPGIPAPAGNDAQLRVDELKDLDSRPLPDFARNPFEFAPTPEQVKEAQDAKNRELHPPPPAPPPPPAVPFKAMGYQQDGNGQRIAYLMDDQNTYVVRQGQQFGQRFKVLKISNASVEVEDESYHQIVQLPYPQ